jgi:hypothetical protein
MSNLAAKKKGDFTIGGPPALFSRINLDIFPYHENSRNLLHYEAYRTIIMLLIYRDD